ncbi:MAG: isochorismatase family cysteine hydrolase [Candidatus Bipolaricaulota bacterium]
MKVPEIERREEVPVGAEETALLVVHMQRDFVSADGSLFVPDAPKTVAPISDLLGQARAAGALVVFTQDWHLEDDPEFSLWGPHAVGGSSGAEIVEELSPQAGEPRIHTPTYDTFFGTPMDHILRRKAMKQVVLVGTMANVCVLHAAGSAALRGYGVVWVEDGVSALSEFDMAVALRQATFLYGASVTKASGVRFRGS